MVQIDPTPIIEGIKSEIQELTNIQSQIMAIISARPRGVDNHYLVDSVKLIANELVDLEVNLARWQDLHKAPLSKSRGAPNRLMDDVSLRKAKS